MTQPRVGNVVRRRDRTLLRVVPLEAPAQALDRPASAGKQDAGAGQEVGPGRSAQQRAGPAPRVPMRPRAPAGGETGPGSSREAREEEGPRTERGCGAPGTLQARFSGGPGGAEGKGLGCSGW